MHLFFFIEKSRKKHGILYCTHFVLCRTIKESFKNFILHYITSKSFDSQNFSTCDISCYLILRQIGPPSVSSSAFNDILAKWFELSSPSQFLHYLFIWFFLKTISAQFTSQQSKNLSTKSIIIRQIYLAQAWPSLSLFNNHYFVKHILKYWWMSLYYFFAGQHINWWLIFGRDCFKNSSITVPNRHSLFTDLLPRSKFKK